MKEGSHHTTLAKILELDTKVHKVLTITEKAPIRIADTKIIRRDLMVSICLSLRTFTLCQRSFVKIFAMVRLHLYQIRDSLLCLCELLQQGGRVLRSWRSSHLIFIFMISSLQSLASRRGASTWQDYRYLTLLRRYTQKHILFSFVLEAK